MAGAFRQQLRTWGEQCGMTGRPVKIRLRASVHGSVKQAYVEARRIVTSFASLRTWERNNVRRRITKELGAERTASRVMPMVTPFENIICRIYKMDDGGGYEVHFIRDDDPILGQMFEEIDEDGNTVQPVVLSPLSVYQSGGFEDGWIDGRMMDDKPKVSYDPNDIPMDVDPFTGEKL